MDNDFLSSAELYDPSTGNWSITDNMHWTRAWHTATTLSNGKILVTGGMTDGNDVLKTVELYDPLTEKWKNVSSMVHSRYGHTATLLTNGKLLVIGGQDSTGNVLNSAESFDPSTETWTVTGSMINKRSKHTASLLRNGNVLVAGGGTGGDIFPGMGPVNTSEIYDPSIGRWKSTNNMHYTRTWHTASVLENGNVLVVGGNEDDETSSYTPELYNSSTNTYVPIKDGQPKIIFNCILMVNEKNIQNKIAAGCKDDDILIGLGYKPELKREFSYLSAFGQAWGTIGLAPGIAGTLVFALGSGGSVASVWTWIVGCLFQIPVALALGEMGSSMPTSGGVYYWVAKLTPAKYRPLLCWFSAYMITLGYIAGYAGAVYASTIMFLAIISMSTDGNYVPNKYHDYGVYVGFCIITSVMICFSSKILAKINEFYVFYQGLLCVALILAVVIATPSTYRNSAAFVFIDFQNTGDWKNNGWAWCLGFVTPVWVVSGFETSAALAEEAANAQKVIPFAMISSLIASLFIGAGIIIALMFTMGKNTSALLGSSFGQPVGQILYNSLGKNGAVALLFFLFLGFIFNCTNIMFAASRDMFALCRDGGFPFSAYLRVLTTWKAPVRCILACCFISIIIGLLMLANSVAISSIFNTAIIAIYFGYMSPIISRLIWNDFTPGIFYLGRFSFINSVVAVLWMMFIIVLLFFPTYQTPNAEQMNYAIVVIGFVVIFCLLYYYFPKYGGKTFFRGPVRTTDSNQEFLVETTITRF
ncbi:unnamed protein product [Adineta steineri]|uniref:Uncharacterized protein n=2 Tax=Adineta steineri TaxID=433720 RepID=A0A819J4G6_9BILA|nr:unnamed protein product [Adineta steineri]